MFWELVQGVNPRVGQQAQRFIDTWLDRTIGANPGALAEDKAARALLEWRESALKRHLARLTNKRALDTWRGASGYYRLDYRWTRPVRDILADLANPTEAS
jgi:hypothetical protein